MQWWGIACGRLKKKQRVFSSSTPLMLSFLSFFFSGLWFMVGSGRMPPGLSVMYGDCLPFCFVLFFFFFPLLLLFLFLCLFFWSWPQPFKVSPSKVKTQSKERNTQIKIVFLSTGKKIIRWVEWNFFYGNEIEFFIWCWGFFHTSSSSFLFFKGQIIVFIY